MGWPFFLAYRQAGVTFFGHPKKVTNGTNAIKGKCRSTESFNCTSSVKRVKHIKLLKAYVKFTEQVRKISGQPATKKYLLPFCVFTLSGAQRKACTHYSIPSTRNQSTSTHPASLITPDLVQ
jgi:hypothetical protein